MLYNLKIAFRSLIKNRLYSIINVAGLAISLATCSFILLWVQDEMSYDRFHKDADEIYMGVAHFTNADTRRTVEVTSGLFAPEAKENFGEVTSFCRIRSFSTDYVLADGIKTGSQRVFVADSSFFTFFNFHVVRGDSPDLLQKPDEIVISQRLANELFGDDNPVGKIIRIKGMSESYREMERPYHVAAVMNDLPANTYLPRAEIIIPQQSDSHNIMFSSYWNSWSGCEFLSFIKVKEGTDVEKLAKDITNLQTNSQDFRYFTLQPLVGLHLYTLDGEPAGIRTVWIFVWIAVAIFIISCINYVNLVTGRSAKRNHEVGLKKILGARKRELFFQLMTEAMILFLTAIIIAFLLNLLFTGILNQLSGKEIYFGWNNQNVWVLYGAMLVATLILAGMYPALSISSFKLLNMLQGKMIAGGNAFVRKLLIITQFIASIVLIASTITMESQLTFIRQRNLGYNQEQVFTCQTFNMSSHYQAIKAELMMDPSIQNVNGASDRITDVRPTNLTGEWEGKTGEDVISYYRFWVDSTFFENMDMPFVEGSGFGPGEETQYIINETMAKSMGMAEPVVGKWMVADFGQRGTIVGVIKDFNFHSLYREIEPLIIFPAPDWASTLYIRTTAKDAARAITAVEKIWKEYNPNYTFTYSFMDESFEQLYRADIRTGRLFGIFAFIAVLISCLGLFGLVTYTAEAKFKEIGIRKVLGASVGDIVALLTMEFLLLVGIALLIAFPLAYYWLQTLLQDFAYRIAIGWQIFGLTGVIVIVITLLTVGWKAVKAASANPVDAIKME
ncbi:MAG: ABC transporter permease [Tannerella sp.]|jgi:ABC-type antimicrobial peptide transport system permease subunit|nr:ABC transporter permease [Tannerella sp.]